MDEFEEFVKGLHEEPINERDEPIIRLRNMILYDAVKSGATDIYIQNLSAEERVSLKYKVDGKIVEQEAPPLYLIDEFVNVTKEMFGLVKQKVTFEKSFWDKKLNRRGKLIDVKYPAIKEFSTGDIATTIFKVGGVEYGLNFQEINTGNVPTWHMELFNSNLANGLDEKVKNALSKYESGLILVSGLPDNGKSVLGYNILENYIKPEKSSLILEQKSAYPISQPNILLNPFGSNLERILRDVKNYNPDFLLIDEISNEKLAKAALFHANNDTLVIGTIPAKDKDSACSYLSDLGLGKDKIKDCLLNHVNVNLKLENDKIVPDYSIE